MCNNYNKTLNIRKFPQFPTEKNNEKLENLFGQLDYT